MTSYPVQVIVWVTAETEDHAVEQVEDAIPGHDGNGQLVKAMLAGFDYVSVCAVDQGLLAASRAERPNTNQPPRPPG